MPGAQNDQHDFIPALSAVEACSRIFSLTGALERTARGEKRAIVALRDALDLDIDIVRTNAEMAARIAEKLEVDWLSSYEDHTKVNLNGLNALLMGTSNAYHQGAIRNLASNRPLGLQDFLWQDFQPAASKIEAVNRLSSLTKSGPEWLGPGSKEHKRVLINLAAGLAPDIDTRLSKSKLGAALASEFEAPWLPECESTGETISLQGLNTLLAGAERRMGILGASRAVLQGTPEEEGQMLVNALLDGWRSHKQKDGSKRVIWDGRKTINWMIENGINNGPYQNEWQGFYWEARGLQILNAAFSPNPNPPAAKYINTIFDYSLRFVWDLKAHTEHWANSQNTKISGSKTGAPLNDQQAMDACIADQGLGFLVVSGIGIEDSDHAFVEWHRKLKASVGKKSSPSNSGESRRRKAAFVPLHVDAMYFRDVLNFEGAKAAGIITGFNQGAQAPKSTGTPGKLRPKKYLLKSQVARTSQFCVASATW